MLDEAKCPHCGTWISGGEFEEIEVEDGGIMPMGANKNTGETIPVCPACETII